MTIIQRSNSNTHTKKNRSPKLECTEGSEQRYFSPFISDFFYLFFRFPVFFFSMFHFPWVLDAFPMVHYLVLFLRVRLLNPSNHFFFF